MRVRDALDAFISHTLLAYPDLRAPFDPDWRSPCELGEPIEYDDGAQIAWRPVARHPATIEHDFDPLERALETVVHPDLKAYFGAYWAAGLEADAVDGHVSLLFPWNEADLARLNENLLGHAFSRGERAHRRGRNRLSLFFACTEPDSDLFLSIDNNSGVVLLEKPGKGPLREVAADLATFIDSLVPRPPALHR